MARLYQHFSHPLTMTAHFIQVFRACASHRQIDALTGIFGHAVMRAGLKTAFKWKRCADVQMFAHSLNATRDILRGKGLGPTNLKIALTENSVPALRAAVLCQMKSWMISGPASAVSPLA
jgi:hypothetical protein